MDKRNRKKKTVDDTVCEIHKFSGYAVLSNCFVRSTNLGCPAIGLLGRVMDLPPEWNFSKAGLIAICPDGETAIDSALNDLKEWGYLEVVVKMPNENPTGRIQTVYKFYEYSAKLGVVGGIAFAAYKLGECNGEVNERMREKYGDEDDDGIGSDDDEDDYRFYDNMDEPDDWCLAPASGAVTPYDIGQEYTIGEEVPAEKCEVPDEPHEKEKPLPQKENKECVKKEVVPPPVRKYAPLSSIKIRGISRYEIETLLIWMLRHGAFYKTDLIYVIDAGSTKIDQICDAFLKAGYIRKEEKSRKTYCNLTKEDFYWLLLEE